MFQKDTPLKEMILCAKKSVIFIIVFEIKKGYGKANKAIDVRDLMLPEILSIFHVQIC